VGRRQVTVDYCSTLEPLARDWDELADRTAAMPWIRPGWIRAWWKAFGRGRLEILVARRGTSLVGVLPLQYRHGHLRSTTNWHTPGFCLLAEDDLTRQRLAEILMRRPSRRTSIYFLTKDGADLHATAAAARAIGRLLITRPILRSPYVAADRDWAAYERRLSTKKLRELRRRRRRLEQQGRVSLEIADGSQRLDSLLAEGWRVEAAAWKGVRGTAIDSRPDTRMFYREVARWGVERGSLRLAFLRLEGRPLAFDFCLEEDGAHYLLKTGYDPAYREFGPGMMIRYEMLSRAFRLNFRTYEFLGADNPWKFDWAPEFRETILLQAFAPSLTGFVDWSAWTYGRPVAKRLLALVPR
jgi:CelD/BcsL family acetyltransferase involved in cellulose biosynthesis